ncbi:MAG: calcium-binding protein [Coleofasciculaceae cyanobacterium SM2_3_26]|nr:calcium-binding protein [Coleofasciculaceae cyanobacterium SM2_3_26]
MGDSGRNTVLGTLPTTLDLSVLADIGYTIDWTAQVAIPPLTTAADDILSGSAGNDIIAGLAGSDRLQGEAGNDLLDGGVGDDALSGQAGNDTLIGGAGNDQLVGGEGDDLLYGGAGNEVLFGQTGRDRFLFDTTSGQDIIGDFVVAEDTIQVSPSTGFTSFEMLWGAIALKGSTTGGGWFSELVLNDQNRITILHDAPLSAANFAIAPL